jgi:hypothetical protein
MKSNKQIQKFLLSNQLNIWKFLQSNALYIEILLQSYESNIFEVIGILFIFEIFLHIGPIHQHQTSKIILLREESNILKFLQANQFETSKVFCIHQNLNLNLETL